MVNKILSSVTNALRNISSKSKKEHQKESTNSLNLLDDSIDCKHKNKTTNSDGKLLNNTINVNINKYNSNNSNHDKKSESYLII